MTPKPLVSVLMTAYNREDYIAEAIESVLDSTYQNFELIITDDGSRDRTVEIVTQYALSNNKVKLFINEHNLGDYVNRNKAASYANGKYLKYLDSDDLMYSHCLQVMVESMEKFPDAGFGLSAKRDPYVPYPISISPHQTYLEHFNGYGHFHRAPGSSIIKKEIFEKVGGFSGQRHIGDMELWFKLAQEHKLVKFPVDLYWSRIHQQSESTLEKKTGLKKIRKELVSSFLKSDHCPIDPKEVRPTLTKYVKQAIKRFL